MIKKTSVIIATGILATSFFAATSFAANKLVVQDATGTKDVFTVDDLGVMTGTLGATIKADDYTYSNQEAYAPINWKGGFYVAKRARGTAAAPAVVQLNDTVFTFDAQAWDGTGWARGGQIMGKVNGTPAAGKIPFYWTFRTMGNNGVLGDRLIITADGYVGIGNASPTHLIHLAGGAYSDGATWSNASSRDLKENIRDISAEEATETIEKLTPVSFNYKDGNTEERIGFIAEDVPDLVSNSDRKSLDSMDITAVLTKVVQEQQKMLHTLQEKITELETSLKNKDAGVAQISTTSYNNH